MSRPDVDADRLHLLHLVPNLVTILGLCAGLTSIRLAVSGNYELAALLIVFAAAIDGLDGLLARRFQAASAFGAELDSLSDFVCFGVAPALLAFLFALGDAPGLGWTAVLVYVVCCCLRLARFNVGRQAPAPRPHFVGVPAPAGALLSLLPVFLTFEGLFHAAELPVMVALHLGLVGALMVSTVPTVSPRSMRVPRRRARWLLIAAAVLVGAALVRPWLLLAVADAVYAAAVLRGLVASALARLS